MVVDVETGPAFKHGRPRPPFDGDKIGMRFDSSFAGAAPLYDVAPNGQHFVVVRPVEGSAKTFLNVVQNWYAEFRDRKQDLSPNISRYGGPVRLPTVSCERDRQESGWTTARGFHTSGLHRGLQAATYQRVTCSRTRICWTKRLSIHLDAIALCPDVLDDMG